MVFKLPTTVNGKKVRDFSKDNFATANFATDNFANNNYPTYKWKVDKNKLMNRFTPTSTSPSALQQTISDKKNYWFDYDNPAQVNSYADIITKTASNMWKSLDNQQPWKQTLGQFVDDSYSLINKGTIQPLLKGDWSALLNNAKVNWSESADLVDNIWKGWAIESGFLDFSITKTGNFYEIDQGKKFTFADGNLGLKKAFVDRENYNFDTGHGATNLAMELATPTNVALMLLGMGGGAAAKTAAKEVGETALTDKVLKSFGKAYKGDAHKAMMAMRMNLSALEIQSLENIAKHATNMKVLSAVNKFKGAVDVVDKLGPQIGIKGTIGIPWKAVKATTKATSTAVRYLANGVDRIITGNGDPSLIKTFQKTPELEQFFTEFSQAQKLMGDPNWTEKLIAREDVLGSMASIDNKEVTQIYKEFTRNIKSERLIKSYIEAQFTETGKMLPWESATRGVRRNQITTLLSTLDEFAVKTSDGVFKTYDEYANFVNMISSDVFKVEEGVTKTVKGVQALKQTIDRLEKIVHQKFALDLADEVEEFLKPVLETVGHSRGLQDELYTINAKRKQTLENALENVRNKLTQELRMYDDAVESVPKNQEIVRTRRAALNILDDRLEQIKKLEDLRSTEYSRLRTKFDSSSIDKQINELQNFVNKYPKEDLLQDIKTAQDELKIADVRIRNKDKKVLGFTSTLTTIKGLIDNFDMDEISDKRITLKNYGVDSFDPSEPLQELLNLKDKLQSQKLSANIDSRKNALDGFINYLDESIADVHRAVVDLNYNLNYNQYTKIGDIGSEYYSTLTDVVQRFTKVVDDSLVIKDLSEQMKSLSRRLYGENVLNYIKKQGEVLNERTKGFATDAWEDQVNSLFRNADGVINIPKYRTLLEDITSITNMFDDTVFEGLGSMQGSALTLADLSYEASDAVVRIKQHLLNIDTEIAEKINAEELQAIFDELTNLEYNIKRSIKNLELTNVFDVDGSKVTKSISEIVGVPGINNFDKAEKRLQEQLYDIMFRQLEPNLPESEQIKLGELLKDVQNRLRDLNLVGASVETTEYVKHMGPRPLEVSGSVELLDKFKTILDGVEGVKNSMDLTADLEVKFSEEVLNSYTMRINSLTRNLHVLQQEDLERILDAVEMGDYTDFPMLNTLEYITRTDTGEVIKFKQLLERGVTEGIQETFERIMGEPWNPVKHTRSELLKTMDTLLEVQQHSETIVDTLEGMVSVRQFYGAVEEAIENGLDQNVANTFLDAVQRLYDNPATLINSMDEFKNPGQWQSEMTKLMHNMEMQLRGLTPYNMKAEAWRDRVFDLARAGKLPDEALTEYTDLFPNNMTHTAVADAYGEYLVHKYILKNDVSKYKYIYLDIEASGLNLHHSTVYQQSVVIPGHDRMLWYINTGVKDIELPEEDTVYKVLFPGYENSSIAELKAMFKDIYMGGDSSEVTAKKLQQYFGVNADKIEIISTNGEQELLTSAYDFIQTQLPPDGAMRYRLHNGVEYDIPLLNNRMKELGLDTSKYNYRMGMVEDTKVDLEEMLKLKRLSTSEKSIIEDLVTTHTIRRASELSSTSMRRLHDVTGTGLSSIDLNAPRGSSGKFLPTMDVEFNTALDRLSDIFDPRMKDSTLDSSLKLYDQAEDLYAELRGALTGVRESIFELNTFEQTMKRFKLVVDETDMTKGQRIFSNNIIDKAKAVGMENVLANHIGIDLMSFNTVDGIYVPTFAPKILHKPNVVAEFFDFGDTKVTSNMMQKMTQVSGNIQKTMMYARNPELVESFEVNTLNELHDILTLALSRHVGKDNFSPILGNLKKGETPLRSFANVYELFKRYNNILAGTESLVSIAPTLDKPKERLTYQLIAELQSNPRYSSVIDTLLEPDGLFKRALSEYGDYAKLFQQEPATEELEKIFTFFKQATTGQIKTLEDLEKAQDSLKYARVLKTLPTYRGLLNSFDTFEEVTLDVIDSIRNEVMDEGLNPNLVPSQDLIYAKLRPLVEAMNNLPGFQKLEEVLTYEPEEMASFLRHQAKGVIVFSNKDLLSSNYFPKRHPSVAQMPDFLTKSLEESYMKLLDNRKAYEDLGINIKVAGGNTILYFKSADLEKIRDIAYTPMKHSYDLGSYVDTIVTKGLYNTGDDLTDRIVNESYDKIKQAMDEIVGARQHLVDLVPDAGSSTLEFMDDVAMINIVEQLQGMIPDGLTVEDMKHLGMFEGNYFNHSILGSVDARRTFMPYTSFNPAKTIYNATDMVSRRLDAQVQYIQLMQLPEFEISNLLGEGKMKPQEMVDYLKNAPHLRVTFLQDKTRDGIKDFKVSRIKIDNIKDLEFAQRVGAVIVNRQTYDTAYGVINNNRITHPVIRFIDRTLVRPFKLGWLAWNYGVVARNIVDTSTKNIQTTKDLAIIPVMAETFGDYWKYKDLNSKIYEYASSQRIHIDTAVDEFFQRFAKDMEITREVFDMFTEYSKVGGEMGLVKEAIQYYGDATDKLYKRLGSEESGLTSPEFRELLNMPDDVAESWLRQKFPDSPEHIRVLSDAKADRLIYKRAYEMHRLYKGKDIAVDDFVNYLKSGRVQPEYEEIYSELMSKTANIKVNDDLLTKAFNHPIIARGMDANMASEEILRISLYRYLKDYGYTPAEAMSEIATTHFNYDHKSMGQLYMEMLMPFSTFRFLNIEYWANQLMDYPGTLETITKGWAAMTGWKDRDIEDVMMRRSLRYQIESGNIILDEDSGLTMKLNPSALDAMEFFANPVSYVTGGVHSAATGVWNLFNMEPYDGESEEDFYRRKKYVAQDLIPFVGTHINRWQKANDKGMNPVLGLLLGPLFNTTWTPAQGGAYATWGNNQYAQRYYRKRQWNNYPRYGGQPRVRNFQYYRKTYPKMWYHFTKNLGTKYQRTYPKLQYGYRDWSNYSTFNRTYYSSLLKFSRGSVFPTKNSRSLNTAFSDIWRRSMTKKGNPKYKFLGFPTNKWTLQLKVNILRNITSYNRWQ